MEQAIEAIQRVLDKFGQPTTVVSDDLLKLDQMRVTSDTDAPEEVFLYRLSGTPCFPRGDLTTVTGPAKCGKTFYLTMLMACAVRRQMLALERIREEPLKVLWYDTEQSKYTTKRILMDRIGTMLKDDGLDTFPDEQYYVFNVRHKTPKERVDYLELALKTYCPDICIIDGIADLLDDINSGTDSVQLIMQLLTMADTYKCNITTVIHLNRSGEKLNLRGWLGTVMVQKSYEVFNCERVPKSHVFTTSLTFSRRFFLDEAMCYVIDEKGQPVISNANKRRTDSGQEETDSPADNGSNTFNQEFVDNDAPDPKLPWDFRKLFTAAFDTAAMLGYDDLEKRVKAMANIQKKQYYYKVFNEAERLGIIKKELTKTGRVGIILLPPS